MIHTAEEILQKHLNIDEKTLQHYPNGYPYIIEAINEARIEAIKECAEQVETINTSKDPFEPHYEVDKQSILKLLDQIK